MGRPKNPFSATQNEIRIGKECAICGECFEVKNLHDQRVICPGCKSKLKKIIDTYGRQTMEYNSELCEYISKEEAVKIAAKDPAGAAAKLEQMDGLVRCRDCRFFWGVEDPERYGAYCSNMNRRMPANGFCNYGARE